MGTKPEPALYVRHNVDGKAYLISVLDLTGADDRAVEQLSGVSLTQMLNDSSAITLPGITALLYRLRVRKGLREPAYPILLEQTTMRTLMSAEPTFVDGDGNPVTEEGEPIELEGINAGN